MNRAKIAYEAWCGGDPLSPYFEMLDETERKQWQAVADALDKPPLMAIHPDGTVTAVNEDSALLDWVLPILSLADGPTDERAMKLAGALILGMSGRDAIRAARKVE
jgi:signal transduction protein with GAF and PtsI domain